METVLEDYHARRQRIRECLEKFQCIVDSLYEDYKHHVEDNEISELLRKKKFGLEMYGLDNQILSTQTEYLKTRLEIINKKQEVELAMLEKKYQWHYEVAKLQKKYEVSLPESETKISDPNILTIHSTVGNESIDLSYNQICLRSKTETRAPKVSWSSLLLEPQSGPPSPNLQSPNPQPPNPQPPNPPPEPQPSARVPQPPQTPVQPITQQAPPPQTSQAPPQQTSQAPPQQTPQAPPQQTPQAPPPQTPQAPPPQTPPSPQIRRASQPILPSQQQKQVKMPTINLEQELREALQSKFKNVNGDKDDLNSDSSENEF